MMHIDKSKKRKKIREYILTLMSSIINLKRPKENLKGKL